MINRANRVQGKRVVVKDYSRVKAILEEAMAKAAKSPRQEMPANAPLHQPDVKPISNSHAVFMRSYITQRIIARTERTVKKAIV